MIYRKAYFADCARHMGAVFPVVLAVGGLVFLSKLLGETVAGALPLYSLWQFLALTVVKYLPQLLNVSLFAGILLALERAFYRREMTAWYAAGIGLRHFTFPGAAFAAPLVCLVALFSCAVSPWSVRAADSLRARLLNDINPENVAPGEFAVVPGGGYTYFLRGDETDSGNIFVAGNAEDAHQIISARAARRGGEFIELSDGALYRLPLLPGGEKGAAETMYFERMEIHIPQGRPEKERRRGAKFADLEWRSPPDRAEIAWRINQPLAALFFALLAPLLGASFAGGKHRHSFLMAVLLFIIHLNLMYFVRDKMADDALPAAAGVLIPPAAVFVIALFVRRAAAP